MYCCLGDAPPCLLQAAVPSVCWHVTTKLHGITIHKAMIYMLTEQIGSAEDVCWKVPSLNLGKGSDNSEVFHGFPHLLLADVRLYFH